MNNLQTLSKQPFVCYCGINIAGMVDMQAVVNRARAIPSNEAFLKQYLSTAFQKRVEAVERRIDIEDV